MHRLFIALRPPAPIRNLLLGLMEGVRNARWQDEEQLHLTLRFIGDVDRHGMDDIVAALGQISFPPVEIALSGMGTFDRRGNIDTLWAGVTPDDGLHALHRKLDQALIRIGIAPDRRAFLPHITLARSGRNSMAGPELRALIERHGGLSSPPFRIDHFALFESHLSHEGARYAAVVRYPLTG